MCKRRLQYRRIGPASLSENGVSSKGSGFGRCRPWVGQGVEHIQHARREVRVVGGRLG
jgi:hypothetical protein